MTHCSQNFGIIRRNIIRKYRQHRNTSEFELVFYEVEYLLNKANILLSM